MIRKSRIAFAPMAVLLVASLAACTSAPRAPRDEATAPKFEVTAGSIGLSDEFELVSESRRTTATATVVYRGAPVSLRSHPEVYLDILFGEEFEFLWLQAYVLNAVLRQIDCGSSTNNVKVSVSFHESNTEPKVTDWFDPRWSGLEWCESSLALRRDGLVAEVAGGESDECDSWIPMNASTFADWYGRLERAVPLNELFSGPAVEKESSPPADAE